MEIVNCLLRNYADEEAISDQDATLNKALEAKEEDELAFYTGGKKFRVLCGYICKARKRKWLLMQGVSWEERAEVRDQKMIHMPVEVLAKCAERRGEE